MSKELENQLKKMMEAQAEVLEELDSER